MDSPGTRPLLPHLRLDDLLAELQARLQAVLSTRDRVQSLLAAVVGIGSELDLQAVLRNIVTAAAGLADARYGALGVIGANGRLADFIPVGLDQQEIARIAHWPDGRGLLGELITHPRPLRLPDIAAHPGSFGFPAGHPPMQSFLGVPVRIRDEIYGHLYLTEKRGGGPFDEDDEAVVIALATAAGVAIDNARLYDEARRRQQWLQASADVSRRLLSGADPADVLDLVTQRVLEMSGADLAVLALPDQGRPGLVIRHAAGRGAAGARGLALPEGSLSATVLASGEPVTVAEFSQDERVTATAREHLSLGPAVIFALGAPGNPRGVLTVGRVPGSLPLTHSATEMIGSFAAQAGVALELADGRRDAEQLTVLQDRERIARDLHDLVIQRLYATGMSLQSALPLISAPPVAQRVSHAVDAMDETIREIRSAIFALHAPPDLPRHSGQDQIAVLCAEMTQLLGFAPALTVAGELDDRVPAEITVNLLVVIREGLSNAARHARAARVDVTVEVRPDALALVIRDDGGGMPASATRRSGLSNLAARATQLGGTFRAGPADGAGTELRWQVPLPLPGPARSRGGPDQV